VDGIEAITPEPQGDVTLEEMKEGLGDDLVLLDGIPALEYRRQANATYETWPFDVPFHLILNLAIGGTWGGIKGVDDEAFPQRMLVDYVRYYAMVPPETPEE
jgi:hypothetical protein